MIKREKTILHGKEYQRIYSTVDAVVRCGARRYVEAIDPIDVDKTYFEEGVENEDEEEQ